MDFAPATPSHLISQRRTKKVPSFFEQKINRNIKVFCVEGTETGLSYGVEADGLEYTRTQDHLGEQAFFAFFVVLGILLAFPARVHDADDHFKFDLGLCHDDQAFFI